MDPSLIGKEFDKYRILEKLGQGGMGIVYKALDKSLEQIRALKILYPDLARDEAFIRRFRNEAINLAKLRHPNIVTIHTFDDKNEIIGPYIVMEFIDGMNLRDLISRTNAVPYQKALPLFKEVLHAIEYAHQKGIIHRDIKPSNVMINKEGTVRLTDFGLAKDFGNPNSTVTLGTAGTLYYMPPEQVKSLAAADRRSDFYSVGMTFYELLAGRTPFEKEDTDFTIRKRIVEEKFVPPDRFKRDIPRELVRIIMKAIEKEPQKRYTSAREMLQAIEAFEIDQRNTESIQPEPPKPARNKLWLTAAIVAVMVVVVIFAGKIFEGGNKDGQSSPSTPAISLGALVLNVVPYGSVQVDGENRGAMNTAQEIEVAVAAGKHEILFQHPTYGSMPATVTVKANEQIKLTCYFEKYFNINAVDEAGDPLQADIVVDNSMTYAKTPYQEYALDPGKHEVRITMRGYETADGPQSVNVQPSLEKKILELAFNLRKLQ